VPDYLRRLRGRVGPAPAQLDVAGGCIGAGDPETLELRYFPRAEAPRLFNRQPRDALADLAAGSTAVFR
jgi:hypothetical protein